MVTKLQFTIQWVSLWQRLFMDIAQYLGGSKKCRSSQSIEKYSRAGGDL